MTEVDTKCEPVIWGATPEEIASAVGRDPNQARVVRPPEENPAAPPPGPITDSVVGYDLTGYYWRRPEAGVAAGGLSGRWWVSLSGSGVTPDTRIRPLPIRLDVGEPLTIKSVLPTGSLFGVLHLSGSEAGGTELLNEWIAAPDTIELIGAARSRNPHISEVGNGRVAAGDAAVLVGCTVPKIPVSLDGLDRTYLAQDDPLWRAGIDRMDWIFGEEGFRPADVYRQIGWTLTPDAPAVSGSWVEWPWEWNVVDPFDYRAGFITPISASIQKWRQPAAGADPIAQNQKRLEGFLTEITGIWNGINADSNIIRGLQILGGNARITQQPARGVRFGAAALPGGGPVGGSGTGGGGGIGDAILNDIGVIGVQ